MTQIIVSIDNYSTIDKIVNAIKNFIKIISSSCEYNIIFTDAF